MKTTLRKSAPKVVEFEIKGAHPLQPIEFMDVTKDMVGYRIRFVWPKPKPVVKKWWEFWK